jgi:hypothetical protein
VAVGPECVFVFVKPHCEVFPGHVSLYIPDSMYLLVVCCLCVSLLPIVLLVRNAILMLVRLKMFVTNAVSLPMYVNVAHFCFYGIPAY